MAILPDLTILHILMIVSALSNKRLGLLPSLGKKQKKGNFGKYEFSIFKHWVIIIALYFKEE